MFDKKISSPLFKFHIKIQRMIPSSIFVTIISFPKFQNLFVQSCRKKKNKKKTTLYFSAHFAVNLKGHSFAIVHLPKINYVFDYLVFSQ